MALVSLAEPLAYYFQNATDSSAVLEQKWENVACVDATALFDE